MMRLICEHVLMFSLSFKNTRRLGTCIKESAKNAYGQLLILCDLKIQKCSPDNKHNKQF